MCKRADEVFVLRYRISLSLEVFRDPQGRREKFCRRLLVISVALRLRFMWNRRSHWSYGFGVYDDEFAVRRASNIVNCVVCECVSALFDSDFECIDFVLSCVHRDAWQDFDLPISMDGTRGRLQHFSD
jgi:hypothetical protein